MAQCKGRHHKWNAAGTACSKCGAPKRKPGRPARKAHAHAAASAAPAAARNSAGTVAARIAATLGPPASPAPFDATDGARQETAATDAQDTAAAPPTPTDATPADVTAPPPPATGWCKRAGKLGTKGLVGIVDLILERGARRIANDPDEDDVEEFAIALGQQLAIWFPDTALTPAKTMAIAGTSIVVGMCYGSQKLPPPPIKKVAESKPTSGEAAADGATDADTSPGATSAPS